MRFSEIAGKIGVVKPFTMERSEDDEKIEDGIGICYRIDGSAHSLQLDWNSSAHVTAADRYACSNHSCDKHTTAYAEAH